MNCDFPATQLIELRREISERADKSNDPYFVRSCCNFVLAVDLLRLAHEDVDGCQCWLEAVEMLKSTKKGNRR